MTMDPIKRMAVHWYRAEYGYNQPGVEPSDMYTVGVPRVRAVLAGEVRWSEASPGDKAIWRGRPRADISNGDWAKIYDTVFIAPTDPAHTHKLFGVANIGNIALTNLQVAGQALAGQDADFDVRQIYAELSRDLTAKDQILIRPRFGTRYLDAVNLREIVFGYPIGKTLHPRQDFHVWLDWFKLSAPLTVVIHIEGTKVQRVANLATHTSVAGGGGVKLQTTAGGYGGGAGGGGGGVKLQTAEGLTGGQCDAQWHAGQWYSMLLGAMATPDGPPKRCHLPAGHSGYHTVEQCDAHWWVDTWIHRTPEERRNVDWGPRCSLPAGHIGDHAGGQQAPCVASHESSPRSPSFSELASRIWPQCGFAFADGFQCLLDHGHHGEHIYHIGESDGGCRALWHAGQWTGMLLGSEATPDDPPKRCPLPAGHSAPHKELTTRCGYSFGDGAWACCLPAGHSGDHVVGQCNAHWWAAQWIHRSPEESRDVDWGPRCSLPAGHPGDHGPQPLGARCGYSFGDGAWWNPYIPPESHRWRARGRGGSVMSSWIPELDARRSAALVGGYVETWDEFVRTLYPLGVRCSLPAGHPGDHTPHVSY